MESKKTKKSEIEISPALVIEKLNSTARLSLGKLKTDAENPTQFFNSIPKLDSLVCDNCFYAAKCPFFRGESVCLTVSSVFEPTRTDNRGLNYFKSVYKELIRKFIEKSSILTNYQSVFDVDRMFAIVLILKQLNKDVNNKRKKFKAYSGYKTFDIDTWGLKREKDESYFKEIESRRERLGLSMLNKNNESRKNLKNGFNHQRFI